MVQTIIPHFRAQKSGSIINIASVNGRQPWPYAPAYSASKAALINLTRALAVTLGKDNVNVNAVCPGTVITPMAEELVQRSTTLQNEGTIPNDLDFLKDLHSLREHVLGLSPLKRSLSAQDVGHAVVFFASPRSQSITGQALNVDCGVLMS